MHPGRLLLIAVFFATWWFAQSAFAESATPLVSNIADCYDAAFLDIEDDAEPRLAENSCCDGNGGVCGCSAFGPVMCCDGRLSPTCMCRDGSPVTTLASTTH